MEAAAHEVVREATRDLIKVYMSKEAMSLSRVADDLAIYTESEIVGPVVRAALACTVFHYPGRG